MEEKRPGFAKHASEQKSETPPPVPPSSVNPAGGLHVEAVMLKEAYEKREEGKYMAAKKLFTDVLRHCEITLEKKQKSVIHGQLAELLFWLGDYEEARHHGIEAIRHHEDNDTAYVILGKIAVAEYNFPQARGYFSQVSEENPARYLGLCLVAFKLRNTAGAEEFLQQAESRGVSKSNLEYRVYKAYIQLLKGSVKSALLYARELLQKCQDDPALILLLAELFMTAGSYGEAVGAARLVQSRCKENDMVFAIFAHAAYAEEDYVKAEKNAARAVELNPRNAYAKTALMKLACRRGDYMYAEELGKEILEASPEYSLGHANLGDVYFNQGFYELAKFEYEHTAELMNSDTKGARLRKARICFIEKNYQEAVSLLTQLIENHHTYYDDAMCDLLLCYDALGDEKKKTDHIFSMQLRRSMYHRTEQLLKSFM